MLPVLSTSSMLQSKSKCHCGALINLQDINPMTTEFSNPHRLNTGIILIPWTMGQVILMSNIPMGPWFISIFQVFGIIAYIETFLSHLNLPIWLIDVKCQDIYSAHCSPKRIVMRGCGCWKSARSGKKHHYHTDILWRLARVVGRVCTRLHRWVCDCTRVRPLWNETHKLWAVDHDDLSSSTAILNTTIFSALELWRWFLVWLWLVSRGSIQPFQ